MIPKIIHYCWFGHGEMPQLAKCLHQIDICNKMIIILTKTFDCK